MFQLKALQKRMQKNISRFFEAQAVPEIYEKNRGMWVFLFTVYVMLNAVYICFYGLKCILTFLFLFCRDIHDFLFLPFLDDQDAHCRCGNLHSLLAPLQYIFCKNCLPSYNVSQNQLFCVTRKLQKVEIAIRSNIHHDDMYCKHFFLPHLF